MLSHLVSGWKGLHMAKNKQPGKKLEDVACKRESLFQVWDFSLVFPLCLQKLSQLELCVASKGSETSACQ